MKILPVVTIRGLQYFRDDRLKQYRAVVDPFHVIEFDEEKVNTVDAVCYHGRFSIQGCPDCRFHEVLATAVREA